MLLAPCPPAESLLKLRIPLLLLLFLLPPCGLIFPGTELPRLRHLAERLPAAPEAPGPRGGGAAPSASHMGTLSVPA